MNEHTEFNDYSMVAHELENEIINISSDIVIDYAELGLDAIFDSEILSEIPVIKTITAVCKTGLAIRDRFLSKKLLSFLISYHNSKIDENEKQKFILEMENKNFRNRVIDTIMIYIDRFTECTKAELLSKLLIGYINGIFDWEKFLYYLNCLDYIFIHDLKLLKIFYDNQKKKISKDSDEINNYGSALSRMEYLGFIAQTDSYSFSFTGMSPININYQITLDGVRFFETINHE